MPKKETEILYTKILREVNRHLSGSNKVSYVNLNGIETETVFRIPPTPEELEGLLLWLNKEQLPQA
jgi:hypothetical protein